MSDAHLKVAHTRGGPLIVWWWTSGRRTVSQAEHEEMVAAITEAEERYDPAALESGTVVARVDMNDDETIRSLEWQEV